MTAYDAAQWSDFAVAQVGASAALLGLVIVGISINLRDILGSKVLVNRACEAVAVLASVLVAATAVLVPHQARDALAIELMVIGAVCFGFVVFLQRGTAALVVPAGDRGPTRGSMISRRVLGLGSAALVVVTGITLAAEAGGGLYWWPAAVVVAYLAAIINVWVLLVEILR